MALLCIERQMFASNHFCEPGKSLIGIHGRDLYCMKEGECEPVKSGSKDQDLMVELSKHLQPLNIPRPDHLEPGGELLFTSPMIFDYYQRVGVHLLDTPHMWKPGVLFILCLPSFSPE